MSVWISFDLQDAMNLFAKNMDLRQDSSRWDLAESKTTNKQYEIEWNANIACSFTSHHAWFES